MSRDRGLVLSWASVWGAVIGVAILGVACSSRAQAPSSTPSQAAPVPSPEGLVAAPVVEVLDGATIDVQAGGRVLRVRYLGVEIPDGSAFHDARRYIAEEALRFNRFMVEGRTVELQRDALDADGAGRLLRYVYVNGQMVNTALLTNGYAGVATTPESFTYKSEFLAAQELAKADGRGMWVSLTPASGTAPRAGDGTPSLPPTIFGTLPAPRGGASAQVCDYSGSGTAVIKGNVDPKTGQRAYHVPGGVFYATTVIEASQGDRWFCTEFEAIAAGWTKSAH